MSQRVYCIHGMADDGKDTVHQLVPYIDAMEGFIGVPCTYPMVSARAAFFGLRNTDHRPADMVMDRAQYLMKEYAICDGCDLIVHSMGALVANGLMWLGLRARRVISFAAAVDQDRPWPVHGMEIFYNVGHPGDRALAWGEFLHMHDFGALGAEGYLGPLDDRIVEVDGAEYAELGQYQHSHYFKSPNLETWGAQCSEWLRAPS